MLPNAPMSYSHVLQRWEKTGQRQPHIPEERFAEAVPLAGCAAVLICGMRNIGVKPQLLWHALHEECVTAAEGRHGQDAK